MTSRTGRTESARGFTLIEIMLSVAVLSFGLVVVLGSFATALDCLKRSRETMKASYLLEEKMEELVRAAKEEGGLAPGRSDGIFEGEYGGHGWAVSVNPDTDGLAVLELTVSWTEGRKPRTLSAAVLVDAKKQ